ADRYRLRYVGEHFADALALRNDREDVRLAFDAEVDHDAVVVVPGLLDGLLDLVDGLDRNARKAIRPGEHREVGPAERSPAVAPVLEVLLPLPNHPEIAIVDDGDLDVPDALLLDRGQLLIGHLESAVPADHPDGLVRAGDRR